MKRRFPIATLIFIYCFFTLTVGQFIPIYFTDYELRGNYYLVIFLLSVTSSVIVVFQYVYSCLKESFFIAVIESMFSGFVIFVISGLMTFFVLLTAWSDARTFYVRKDNSDIKIVSRYINEGAFGGGTAPEDFHIVLRRPLTSFLKMETAIDTTQINKDEWVKFAE